MAMSKAASKAAMDAGMMANAESMPKASAFPAWPGASPPPGGLADGAFAPAHSFTAAAVPASPGNFQVDGGWAPVNFVSAAAVQPKSQLPLPGTAMAQPKSQLPLPGNFQAAPGTNFHEPDRDEGSTWNQGSSWNEASGWDEGSSWNEGNSWNQGSSWSSDNQGWNQSSSSSWSSNSPSWNSEEAGDHDWSSTRPRRGGIGSGDAPGSRGSGHGRMGDRDNVQVRSGPVTFVSSGTVESKADQLAAERTRNTFTASKPADDDDGDEGDLYAPGISSAFGGSQSSDWQSSRYGPCGGKGLGKDRFEPYHTSDRREQWSAFSGALAGQSTLRESLRGVPGAPRPPPKNSVGRRGDSAPTNGGLAVLFISEKPAIAQAFAYALSPDGKFRKESTGSLPTYAFKGPWIGGEHNGPPGLTAGMPCEYRSTSTIGHIYSVDFPLQLRRWKGNDPEHLFDALTIRNESNPDVDLPQHLADEASRCHLVVLCLDCDREGEAIGYECLDSVLPNLARHPQISAESAESLRDAPMQGRDFADDPRVWRARFSSLAPGDLQSAVKALSKPDPLQARSVDARAEIDLKVGVALTRLITLNTRDEVAELAPKRESEGVSLGALISYGPCQTPTLGFCVQQWDQIQKFAKEVVYTLDLQVETPSGSLIKLKWKPPSDLMARKPKAKKKLKARSIEKPAEREVWEMGTSRREIIEEFVERMGTGGQCVCESKSAEEATLERPTALNTVELLKSCSRELGIDPQRAMSVAEKLYLAGLLTYPRTETTRYPPSFNAKEYLQEHAEHAKWGEWSRHLLGGKVQQPREGEDFGDHPPITPVWCASEEEVKQLGGQMAKTAAKLYELVVKRFLASVSPDVKYFEHQLVFDLGGFKFELRGNEVTEWGYYRLAPGAILSASNALALLQCNVLKQNALELVQQASPGMQLKVVGLSLRKIESKPPKLLTESELLTQMERNQIGTDASMPTHVSNVVARGYVEVQGQERRMCPTILGVWLVHGLQAIDAELTQAAIRARIEKDVTEVAEGKKKCEDVVADALTVFKGKFHAVRDGMTAMVQELHSTKDSKHLWEQLPDAQQGPPEKKKKKKALTDPDPDADPEETFVIPPPLSGKSLPRSAAGSTPSAAPATTGRKRPASTSLPQAKASAKKAKVGTAPSTGLAKLQKENKTLVTKLEIAQIRAENAELKLKDLERKFSDLEARVSQLQANPANFGRGGDRGRGARARGRGSGRGT